jgi:hypothetical protein
VERFKQFIENEKKDVEQALEKLPLAHQKLAHGFELNLEPTHTLKGDGAHVGEIIIHPKKKSIRVSSPWNYGREFALFHEIGHLVWEFIIKGKPAQKEWEALCSKTKDKKKDEPPEELWCHAYANHFIKFPMVIHSHPEWTNFIKKVIRNS